MGEEQKQQKPDFKDVEAGPMDQSNRECRDVFCCLLFLLNIVGMIYCTAHAYANGDPSKIYRGVSDYQQICGEKGGLAQDYPYVYFYNPLLNISNRFCVKTCPTFNGSTLTTLDCYRNDTTALPNCNYLFWLEQNGSVSASTPYTHTINAILGYETTVVLDRVCAPSSAALTNALKDVITNFTSSLQQGSFASFTSDVNNNWQWLLAGIGFAVICSLLYMFLLRCLVGCIVWLSIIGSILTSAGMGVLFCYNAGVAVFKNNLGFLGLPTLSGSDYYATYGYICFGISGFLFLMMLCCCSRIRLAVAVCKVAGQFIIRVCQIMFLPIILATILIGMWACCLLCMIYLLSSTNFTVMNKDDYFTSVADWTERSLLQLYYFIFGTLWSNALIGAIGIFTVASACCMWYFNHGANDVLDSPVSRSLKMAFRYHFGSLAFGSFILALVQFLQMMVQLFKKQAENTGAANNKCFEYAINCLRCCLACVERIVQFINETAYIQIALRGKNFCMAAFDGFQAVINNGMRYLVVAGVGKLMMFLGRLLIAAGSTLAFYCLITFVTSIKATVIEPLYLLVIVFIISYAIGALFIGVYGLAVDTILACFIVDQMNQAAKGSKAALHGPEQLNELLPNQ